MEGKITKIGNNLGVIMTDALKALDLNIGDVVKIDVRGDEIIIKKSPLPEGISSDFLETLDVVLHKYEETLKRLRDR